MASIGKNQIGWGKSFALGTTLDFTFYDGSQRDRTLGSIGVYDYVTSSNNIPFTGTFDGRGNTLSNLKLIAAAIKGLLRLDTRRARRFTI